MQTALTVFLVIVAAGLGLALGVLFMGWATWLVARKWVMELAKIPKAVEQAIHEADAQNAERDIEDKKITDRMIQ